MPRPGRNFASLLVSHYVMARRYRRKTHADGRTALLLAWAIDVRLHHAFRPGGGTGAATAGQNQARLTLESRLSF